MPPASSSGMMNESGSMSSPLQSKSSHLSSSSPSSSKASQQQTTSSAPHPRPFNSDAQCPLEQRRMRDENEFIWANFGEPHAERRKRILAKHGKEIKKLMGIVEWKTKWIAFAVVLAQMTFAYTLPQYFLKDFLASHGWMGYESPLLKLVFGEDYYYTNSSASSTLLPSAAADGGVVGAAPWYTTWLPLILFAWLVGGALTQNMFLGIHEISHHTAFKKPFFNDLLCIWCNFIVAVPFAMVFKSYHQEHHRYLGWEGVDTDLPEHIEAVLLRSLPGKVFFLFFQTLFYAIRPMISRQPKVGFPQLLNWVIMIGWWSLQVFFFGFTRFAIAWVYTLFCSIATGMFHPTSGHFICEHYVFNRDTFQETYSYYGLGNLIGWNVGYHNEHHDFPSVPWSLLPKIKEIAPEFYEPLEQTSSWTMTLVNFLKDSSVSEFSRVKRERGAGRRQVLLPTTPEGNHTPAADPTEMRARLDGLQKQHPHASHTHKRKVA